MNENKKTEEGKIEVLVLDRVPHRQLDHLRSRRLLLLQQVCVYIELKNGVIFALRRVLSEIRPF